MPISGSPRVLVAALALAACLAATGLSGAFAAARAHPILIGKVGWHDSFTISLSSRTGRKVKTLTAGTYTLIVHDYSAIHNFALGSQTLNKRLFTSGIPWIGTRRYTLHLTPGSYAFACSAHPYRMNGTFTVTPSR